MKPLGRLQDHVLLVKRMASATDIDLTQAFDTGDLSHEHWADLVQTCRGCRWSGQCENWLTEHDNEDCAPHSCLNRARFEELRRQQQEP